MQSTSAKQIPQAPLDEQSVLQEATVVVGSFIALLDEEYALMQSRDVGAMPALLVRKNAIVTKLAGFEPQLSSMFLASTLSAPVLELQQLISSCQQLNRRNQTIALVEVRHAHKALALLRSLMKLDDLTLYSGGGALTVAREKRSLGSV